MRVAGKLCGINFAVLDEVPLIGSVRSLLTSSLTSSLALLKAFGRRLRNWLRFLSRNLCLSSYVFLSGSACPFVFVISVPKRRKCELFEDSIE